MLNLPRNFFEEALVAGRCLVCLDGLDEVWAVDRRKAITDAVRALASRYRNNRYLVTSRIVGYSDAPLDRRVLSTTRFCRWRTPALKNSSTSGTRPACTTLNIETNASMTCWTP